MKKQIKKGKREERKIPQYEREREREREKESEKNEREKKIREKNICKFMNHVL